MLLISDLVNTLDAYLDKEQVAKIYKSYLFGAEAHQGQKRQSGEPYIYHPIAVASILAKLKCDCDTIIASILHDVIEDTGVAKEKVAREFGAEVAHMVDGVSKLDDAQNKSRKQAQADNFRKMMLAMSSDIRIIIIKIADRLHNMRTLSILKLQKRQRIAQETLDFYIPMAARLGMYEIKLELESLAVQNLHPWRYRILDKAMRVVRGQAIEKNKQVVEHITEALQKDKIKAKLHYREKSLFSIFSKMNTKNIKFGDLDDVNAIRIIVQSHQNCYTTLGIVHNIYKPVMGKFKDYIAIPKSNGYQSLHTILFISDSYNIEVQIRTEQMDLIAETGIASHWQYKNDFKNDEISNRWLQHIDELQKTAQTSEEFVENIKFDLFSDKVFVFSPDGKIFELPRGATALDFAYAVHTEIGSNCAKATINNSPVYIGTELKNGETVTITTDKTIYPTESWLDIVVTGKAISNIKNCIRKFSTLDASNLGKQILNVALKNNKLTIDDEDLTQLLQKIKVNSLANLYEAIGFGKKDINVIMSTLLNTIKPTDTVPRRINRLFGKTSKPKKSLEISITGMEGMVVKYAKCCLPLPGDKIVGFFESNSGLIVHEKGCDSLKKLKDKELKILNWESNINATFSAVISLQLVDKPGVLAKITSIISEQNTNISLIKSKPLVGSTYIKMVLDVKDRKHLANIIKVLRTLKVVKHIKRIKGEQYAERDY